MGLMTGTSVDGVDVALLESDGVAIGEIIGGGMFAFSDEQRRILLASMAKAVHYQTRQSDLVFDQAAQILTDACISAIRQMMTQYRISAANLDVIGFPGQTMLHAPDRGFSWQIGDGALIAQQIGVPVVSDFRNADIKAGGQGAPFAPLYHQALTVNLPRPLAVLNIGGIANLTLLGTQEKLQKGEEICAFDTGPGNGLLDQWIMQWNIGEKYDRDGAWARKGKIAQDLLTAWRKYPYFRRKPPKSLDRDDFRHISVQGLSLVDGAATLLAFTVESIALAVSSLAQQPEQILVCGGGRNNRYLMESLGEKLPMKIAPVESFGWDGDLLEAQAFGFLATRACQALPLSLPAVTGAAYPACGGVIHQPS